MRSSTSATSLALLGLVACAAFGAPSPDAQPNGKIIPLTRKKVVERTTDEWGVWARNHRESLYRKYNRGASSSSSAAVRQKRGSGTNLIVNQNADSTYFGSLAIGTPLVAYDVILDTGSADLWIAGSTCGLECKGLTTYTPSASSSYNNLSTSFSITYGSGEAAGSLGEDTVQMAGLSVSNQTFAVCDDISNGLLTSPVSGLLGLAWKSISASGATPFWENLVENGAWDSPLMSFYLTRYGNQSQAQSQENGGAFTMGFTNSSYYTGDIEYQSLADTGSYWLLTVSGINVQGSSITLSSSKNAAIDTGTTLIGGPSEDIANIYAQIPGSQAGAGNYEGYYYYPCSTDVTVTMSFGGSSWAISSADFKVTQLSSSQCLGAFFELDAAQGSSTPAWIVGDTFLKNVYSVFRYNPAAVGFANLSSYALGLSGDLDATVPTPTLGSVAAAITATSRSSSGMSLTRSTPSMLVALSTIFIGFVIGTVGLL